MNADKGLSVHGLSASGDEDVLSPGALEFLALMAGRFEPERRALLARRAERQRQLGMGTRLAPPPETREVREGSWRVPAPPPDLADRRVEITGPAEAKRIINALNSGAQVFMADFEDSCSPTWSNLMDGQRHLTAAIRRTLQVHAENKTYTLQPRTATLMVRPRGWHLVEKHVTFQGEPLSASLMDFGLFFFHNAHELVKRGSGPYFYLPKLENHLEARLWNDVFDLAQEAMGMPRGTIRATVLIETVPAAFEMAEILYELGPHALGLNAGRWDYLFSLIKTLRDQPCDTLPDRAQLTMDVPFMARYSNQLVSVCHAHGAQAIGGMAAFVPNRQDPAATKLALGKVKEDKEREVKAGFDGTWVAHPDLVPVALEAFSISPKGSPQLSEGDLLDLRVAGAQVTEKGIRTNLSVALQYLAAWLDGKGAVAINNLMEDVATAEICRAQLWQWRRHGVRLADGRQFDAAMYQQLKLAEFSMLPGSSRMTQASELLDRLVLSDRFTEFLTLPAYELLDAETLRVSTQVRQLEREWVEPRWQGIQRDYTAAEVVRLRPTLTIAHTLAHAAATRLWQLLQTEPFIRTYGALTGAQAVQMVKAGLKALYISGWQVAADANLSGQTYPDQSLYPSNSVPALVRRINNALMRADQIHSQEGRTEDISWYAPMIADAEAGFGGAQHAFELTKALIEAGAGGVHFEDQLASEKKCGHMGGKVLVPVQQFILTLKAARLAADVMGVPTVLIARTDALDATLLTSDIDPRDRPFLTGERTQEGYFVARPGLEGAIARAIAYAPYADLLWCETSTPDLELARRFAAAIHARYPGKLLAYNCSPSFNWKQHLDEAAIMQFQQALAEFGYKFQFITLAGWHSINYHAFDLAQAYAQSGMPAYVDLQTREFAAADKGYTGARHQREVGTGYFDHVLKTLTRGNASTMALDGSTEAAQFQDPH